MRVLLLSLALLLSAFALPAQAQQQLPGLTEGSEYRYIEDGKPYRAVPGKIEVAEVFGYWCPHCAHFAPMLEQWKATMPANAQLVLVPAMFATFPSSHPATLLGTNKGSGIWGTGWATMLTGTAQPMLALKELILRQAFPTLQ